MTDHKDNPLSISWHDSAWLPILNPNNVMDYFAERTNPFYDRTCNNEVIKMQRLGSEHLGNMIGLEYFLLHVQEPILYVVRKQHRHSPTQVTPLADYYILAGVVYQAPDLSSVIGSRMLTIVHQMNSAFEEAAMYSRYHPSKGYWWEFKDADVSDKSKTKEKVKEERGTVFQRKRVDILLAELAKKFPPKMPSPPQLEKQTTEEAVKTEAKEVKVEIKTEKPDPPATTTAATVTTAAPTVTTVTTTAATPIPPPPPPLPQRTGMKPPPEKKPRLS